MSKASTKATIDANVRANGTQAITGSVLNSVLNAMVDDSATQGDMDAVSAKVEDISVVEHYDNIFSDYEDVGIVPDQFILYANGSIGASSGYCYTDYIKCLVGDTIQYNLYAVNSVGTICFYDADKNYLHDISVRGAQGYDSNTLIVPDGAVYVRFSTYITAPVSGIFVSMNVMAGAQSLRDVVIDMQEKSAHLMVEKKEHYDNIFSEYAALVIKENTFINSAGGESASNGYRATDFIPCVGGDTISVDGLFAAANLPIVAFYNADKVYDSLNSVKGIGGVYQGDVAIPGNAAFVRFSWNGGYPYDNKVSMDVFIEMQYVDEAISEINEKLIDGETSFVYSAFGDSISSDEITSAGGHADGLAYPRILTKMLNAELDRHTIPGTGLDQLKTYVQSSDTEASLITCAYGRNDLQRYPIGDIDEIMSASLDSLANNNTFLGKYRWSLETLRNRLENSNALIVCISPINELLIDNPDQSQMTEALRETKAEFDRMRAAIKQFVIREGGANNGWFYIDGRDLIPYDNLYYLCTNGTIDSTHPNTQGEAMMAKGIYDRLPDINLYTTRK